MNYETHENIDDEVYKDDLYKFEMLVLKKKNDVTMRLKENSKIRMML